MNNVPGMMDFIKAFADRDRLKIVGLLSERPATLKQVAADLSLPIRKVYNHLEFLKFVHAVHIREGLYHLDDAALQALSTRQLQEQVQPPAPTWDADPARQKVLSICLNADGTIRHIPNSRTRAGNFRILLEYLAKSFQPGIDYTEKQVNAILNRFHPDIAGLRRDLVDAGLLSRERDGSRYWLSAGDREKI